MHFLDLSKTLSSTDPSVTASNETIFWNRKPLFSLQIPPLKGAHQMRGGINHKSKQKLTQKKSEMSFSIVFGKRFETYFPFLLMGLFCFVFLFFFFFSLSLSLFGPSSFW